MSQLQWLDSGSATTLLSTGLNAFASNSRVVTTSITNTNLDLFGDFELVLTYQGTLPVQGFKVAEIYLLPSVDGTNFPTDDGAADPQRILLVGSFETREPSASIAERLVLPGVTIPPRNFKVLIKNTNGFAWGATGNTLKLRTYRIQTT